MAGTQERGVRSELVSPEFRSAVYGLVEEQRLHRENVFRIVELF